MSNEEHSESEFYYPEETDERNNQIQIKTEVSTAKNHNLTAAKKELTGLSTLKKEQHNEENHQRPQYFPSLFGIN